ncbi:unnamed protein product [Spirodela intermedia]|uniref:Uncharacterized protein n=1 Tax=Spirodela intermedia TaxID=51605 RepID=A0A7I8IZP0_SPIIN|nr:unnamed protein product [Spirodela intermedia]CAA6663053.1 unnamed protein product [Spirodela intermedia]
MIDSSSSTRSLCDNLPPLCVLRACRVSDSASGGNGAASAADSGGGGGGNNGAPAAAVAPATGSAGRRKMEPFGGRSGSVSFCGLTYQALEERELVSSPLKEGTGSFLWITGPLALISSLLLPQFLISGAIEAALKDEILAEMVASIFSEGMFYVGLATFLRVTEQVQRPYLEFSAKRWSLITGLRGLRPPPRRLCRLANHRPPGAVAVAPFLAGCAAQFAFEGMLSRRRSSCWPLLPIIFEVYRLYQLSKGAHFVQRLMFSMRGSVAAAEFAGQSGAFMSLFVAFQVLGVVCLWSLTTFLLRLFPSRPVAENY